MKPLLEKRARTIEVKETVENQTTNDIHLKLRNSVFSGRCTNWYIGEFGRNAASWPGLAIEFWFATLFPDRKAFNMEGGSAFWYINKFLRSRKASLGLLAVVATAALVFGQGKTQLASRMPEALASFRV